MAAFHVRRYRLRELAVTPRIPVVEHAFVSAAQVRQNMPARIVPVVLAGGVKGVLETARLWQPLLGPLFSCGKV